MRRKQPITTTNTIKRVDGASRRQRSRLHAAARCSGMLRYGADGMCGSHQAPTPPHPANPARIGFSNLGSRRVRQRFAGLLAAIIESDRVTVSEGVGGQRSTSSSWRREYSRRICLGSVPYPQPRPPAMQTAGTRSSSSCGLNQQFRPTTISDARRLAAARSCGDGVREF